MEQGSSGESGRICSVFAQSAGTTLICHGPQCSLEPPSLCRYGDNHSFMTFSHLSLLWPQGKGQVQFSTSAPSLLAQSSSLGLLLQDHLSHPRTSGLTASPKDQRMSMRRGLLGARRSSIQLAHQCELQLLEVTEGQSQGWEGLEATAFLWNYRWNIAPPTPFARHQV